MSGLEVVAKTPEEMWVNTQQRIAYEEAAKEGIRNLIQMIGQDPDVEDMLETPSRVVKAFKEMTSGYFQNPEDILSKTFSEKSDEMVLVKNIRFTSICEHHLLPFIGKVHVAYLPGDYVIGLSKIPRLVECFSRRLQVQERMTKEIAGALMEFVPDCQGSAVIAYGVHSCVSCRGVRQDGSEMVTSALLGAFRENPSTRAEFLSLVNNNG